MSSSSLTDRYIFATVRSLPPGLQPEVRDELRTSIADAVDARLDQGESPADAEREVLTELGDPGILAAGYADRPLHLLGPKYFLTWWRLLKLLIAIVPACAFGGVAIGQAVAGAGIGQIIGQGIVVALSVVVHLAFWTTLVFVILERTGADTGVRWNVEQLPEEQPAGAGRGDLIASLVTIGIFVGVLLWDQFRGFVWLHGEAFSIINPELWPWWMSVLFALLAVKAALAVAIFVRGGWTNAFAIVNTAVGVCVMSLGLTALGRGVLFDPRFVDQALVGNGVDADALAVLAVLTGVGIVAITVGDAIDGWRRTRRARLAR